MNLSPLFWTLGLLAASVIGLLAMGARARSRLRREYPSTGRMVDVGGYRLHMHVEGEGSPTVVLDAGAGGIGLTWELVRPALAKVTRVVVYDRAGLGWSDPGPKPRRADLMAEELHRMLASAAVPGPYLLVGHSLGGAVARQFAAKFADEVAGLVMVDSAHEQQVKHFPAQLVKMVTSMMGMFAVIRLIGKVGVLALQPKLVPIGDQGRLPAQTVALARAAIASSQTHVEAMMAETTSVNAAETPPVRSLGDLPLTVISHGRLDANAVPPSLGLEVRAEYEQTWQMLQQEIAALSTRGRRIIAEQSGHNIVFDQPGIVVDAVLEMLNSMAQRIERPAQEVTLAE